MVESAPQAEPEQSTAEPAIQTATDQAETSTQASTDDKESLVMDFSTAFKADTRRGKKKKKAPAKRAATNGETQTGEGGNDELEPDALDDINKDLEDENLFLANDTELVHEEIPRNLTIT